MRTAGDVMLSDWEWKATAQRLDDPRYVAYCSLRTPRRFVTHFVVGLIVVGFFLFLVAADYVPMPPVRWLILLGVIWAVVLLLQSWFAFGPARRPIDRHDVDQEVARIAKQHEDGQAPRREDWSESLWNHAEVALLALLGFMLLFVTGVLPVGWGVLLLIAVSIAGRAWLAGEPPPSRRTGRGRGARTRGDAFRRTQNPRPIRGRRRSSTVRPRDCARPGTEHQRVGTRAVATTERRRSRS